MGDSASEAVGTLQSILGPDTALTIDETDETILVSNQMTDAMWTFRPVQVGRLDRNRVAHHVNMVEDVTSKNPDGTAGTDAPLLISDYVTDGAAEFLRQEGISYLDASGNCFLQSGPLLLFVQGQKPKDRGRRESIRAFNSAGLKLIFLLLVREDLINRTYRDLAALVDISQGTVAYVMQDLKELGFVEKRGKSRTLRRKEDLMDRWTTGYTERLRSNLSRGRFKFLPSRKATGWQSHLSNLWATKWGGEPGADLLTGNFRPELLTLYTREDTSTVCRELEAAPDPEGSIEILDLFWDPAALDTKDDAGESTRKHVPPLLIYADLVASADPRARRAAKTIWDHYLVADAT
jgi:hypothetical protein